MRLPVRLLCALPVSLLVLSGCSQSEDDVRMDAFCSDVPALLRDVTADLNAFDGSDPASGPALVDDAVTRLEAVDPPADVSDEWDRLLTAWTGVRDLLGQADLTDPSANTALAPELESLGTELAEAGGAVDDWGQANC